MTLQKCLVSVLLFLIACLFSCDSGDDSPDLGNIENQIQNYIDENNLDAIQTSSGLYYVIENEGTAPKARTTDFVNIDFSGQLTNGTSLGTTFGSEASVQLDLASNIISGLDEGLQLFGTGGKGTLIMHPDLAFGSNGSGNVPGNAVVIYEIEVLGIYEDNMGYSEALLSEYIAENNLTAQRTATGLYVVIEEMGSDTMPTSTQTVSVHYHGYFLDGTVFDSSIDNGAPVQFALNGVIAGWTEGIPFFGIGGKGKLLIPSHLAYGVTGSQDGSIPPYTPIAFDIELLDIFF